MASTVFLLFLEKWAVAISGIEAPLTQSLRINAKVLPSGDDPPVTASKLSLNSGTLRSTPIMVCKVVLSDAYKVLESQELAEIFPFLLNICLTLCKENPVLSTRAIGCPGSWRY